MPGDTIEKELGILTHVNPSRFVFSWKVVQADIVWERVHSRSLNVWILSVAVFLLISIMSNIDYKFNVPSVLSTTVSYGIYLAVGICFTLIVSPLTLVNAPGRKRFDWKVGMLAFYAVGSMGVISYEYMSDIQSGNLSAYALWAVGLYSCFFLLKNVIYDFISEQKESHIDIMQKRNHKYVRRLLRQHVTQSDPAVGAETAFKALPPERTAIEVDPERGRPSYPSDESSHLPMHLHPVFQVRGRDIVKVTPAITTRTADIFVLPENVHFVNHSDNFLSPGHPTVNKAAPTGSRTSQDAGRERTLSEFFRQVHWRAMGKDVWQNTPIIMRLGLLLGLLGIVIFAVAAASSLEITTSWDYLYDWYLEKVSGISDYMSAAGEFQASIENLRNVTGTNGINMTSGFNSTSYNLTEVSEDLAALLVKMGYNVTSEQASDVLLALGDVSESAEALAAQGEDFSDWWIHINHKILGYEDDYNIFRDTWNYTLYVSVALAAILALVAIMWPIIVAVNTRSNLRMGAWRSNPSAYRPNPPAHVLAGVPGMFLGLVIMASVVYASVIALILFCFTYNPLRTLLYEYFGGFMVATALGMLFVSVVNRLLFEGPRNVDDDGNIKYFNKYSRDFSVMLFFNLLYGTLSAIVRFGFFVTYSLVGVMRVDATLLPSSMRSFDNFYGMYNAVLFFEHQLNNPIMRSAVVLFTEITTSHNSKRRARNRWWLAYTLINNPSLVSLRRREQRNAEKGATRGVCVSVDSSMASDAEPVWTPAEAINVMNPLCKMTTHLVEDVITVIDRPSDSR